MTPIGQFLATSTMKTTPEETDRDLGDEIGRPLAAQRAVKHERQRPRRQHRFGQDHRKRKGRHLHECHSFKRQLAREP